MDKNDFEWLTIDICKEYQKRAYNISANGGTDTGTLRELRIELQKRCNIPEIQAYNILRGFHINDYVRQYDFESGRVPLTEAMKKRKEEAERRKQKELNKNKISAERVRELERKIAILESMVNGFYDDGFSFEEDDY